MKKYTLFKTLIAVWFIITPALQAQNFVQLGTDNNNDASCVCSDLKELSVAINVALDSVWFKIETHNARGAAYGYYIELDWDNNSGNGSDWTGGGGAGPCSGPSNYAVKRDRTICVWPTVKFFEQWNQAGGTAVPGAVINVSYPDAFTTIINTKLSNCDMNADGNFTVFASVGAQNFGYDMLDIMPNTGTYNTAFVGVQNNHAANKDQVVLANKQLIVDKSIVNDISSVNIYDITGRRVLEIKLLEENKIDVGKLFENKGIYIYQIEKNTGEILSGKILAF